MIDPKAVEEAVERLRAEIAPNDYHIVVIAVRRDDIGTVLTALEERTEALERIADPRNIHFTGDAQVVAARALGGHND